MDWQDEAVVLETRPFGEGHAVASLYARQHGRHSGLVRGGGGRRLMPVLQPGNGVTAHWRARLADQLGSLTVEAGRLRVGPILDSRLRLNALAALCALMHSVMPDRDPHPRLFDGLVVVLDVLAEDGPWAALMVRFELELLAELGFGLDLAACAVTGTVEDLSHVSPRSGRVVSAAVAAPFVDRLLRLPGFLRGLPEAAAPRDVADGFALTGHFLERRLLGPEGKALPAARSRMLADLLVADSASGRVDPS